MQAIGLSIPISFPPVSILLFSFSFPRQAFSEHLRCLCVLKLKTRLTPFCFPDGFLPSASLDPLFGRFRRGTVFYYPNPPFLFHTILWSKIFFFPSCFFLQNVLYWKTQTNVRLGAPWKFPEHESWSFAVSSFYFIPLVQFYKEVPLLRRNTHEHLNLL